jgi:hypothetical protein
MSQTLLVIIDRKRLARFSAMSPKTILNHNQ